MKRGWGCQPSPPPPSHGGSEGSGTPPLYLIQQRPAHCSAAAGVSIQRDLCGERDAEGGSIPTGATIWGCPPPSLPTQVMYSMALPTGTPPASPKYEILTCNEERALAAVARTGGIPPAPRHPPSRHPRPC